VLCTITTRPLKMSWISLLVMWLSMLN
jgi:hypothetical protein